MNSEKENRNQNLYQFGRLATTVVCVGVCREIANKVISNENWKFLVPDVLSLVVGISAGKEIFDNIAGLSKKEWSAKIVAEEQNSLEISR